jgi:taurine dioxygenase
MFANMYLAYESLSSEFKRLIDPLEAVHHLSLGPSTHRNTPEELAERQRLSPPASHPIVSTHPETGKKGLYVGSRIRNFVGMTEEESEPILNYLNRHATRYEFIYVHRWSVNDVVMWDNRCALHIALRDYDTRQKRLLIRTTLVGPKSGRASVPAMEAVGR